MKTRREWFVVVSVAAMGLAGTALAQEKKAERKYDMGILPMVILHRAADAQGSPADASHREMLASWAADGTLALWAESTDAADTQRDVLVFRSGTLDEAKARAAGLPGVKAGSLKVDGLDWFVARDVPQRPKADAAPAGYVFGFLVRGPNPPKLSADEARQLQEGHMANINRLADEGKLVLAGPFGKGSGDRRGVFIFKVDSIAEAQRLTDTDPAVKAGSLVIQLHRVHIPAGTLP